jgi:putative ABC transport system permease protein
VKFIALIWAGIFRKLVRSLLTLASIVVAFLLFGLLQAVTVAFNSGAALSEADRLVVAPKYSIIDDIPVSYGARVAQVPGVKFVTHMSWFGGTYKEPGNFFPRWPVDVEYFFEVFPEYLLSDEQKQQFASTRTAAIVGREIADKYELKVGDKIPLVSSIWPNKDGGPWEFDLVGIYEGKDDTVSTSQMFMNYAFFDEYRAFGEGGVGQFMIAIEDPKASAAIARQIDSLFTNSSDETKTQTEKAYNQMFANQTGDIALIMTGILSAVFFTILLLTGNTMSQAIRERIPELAILKTVGFSNRAVLMIVLTESTVMTLMGSALGLAISAFVIQGMPASTPFLGGTTLPSIVVGQGVLTALILGLIVGTPPAVRAMQLSIVDALGEHA